MRERHRSWWRAGGLVLVTLALVGASVGVAGAEDDGSSDAGARASAFFPTQRLTNNSGSSYRPSVAVSGGVVHVAWQDNTLGATEIFYRRSIDSGTTWQTRHRIAPGAFLSARGAALAVDASTVHLVWEGDTGSNFGVWYARSLNKGVTWKPVRRISPAGQEAGRADVAVVGQNVHVVWEDHSDSTVNIWYRRSTNAGVNWDPPIRLSHNNGHGQVPAVAAVGPYVHVVWSDTRDGGGTEVYHRRSVNGGGTWSAARRLSFKPGSSWLPTVEVQASVVHVGWQEEAWGWDAAHKRSQNNGLNWQPATNLSNSTGACGPPSFGVSTAGVDVVWRDGGTLSGKGQLRYRRSTNGGVTWGPRIWLTSTTGDVEFPDIAGWGAQVHMVWHDDAVGNNEIYHKRRG